MGKRMKALLLALILITTMVFTNVPEINAASTDNGLSISKTEVHPGDLFEVSITIPPSEKGCTTAFAKVTFDKTKFEVVSYELSQLDGATYSLNSSVEEANSFGELTYTYMDFMASDSIDISQGHIATAEFRVKEEVQGNYQFTMTEFKVVDTKSTSLLPEGTVTSVSVNVTIPATGVSLSKTTLELMEGSTETLVAEMAPTNTTDTVVWTSSDDTVATVDTTGKVTAVDVGTATITATVGAVDATCTVTVTCNHSEEKLTSVQEKASTCKEKGWDAYYECKCGKLVASDKQTVLEAVPYRDLSGHVLTHHARNEATHATTGNIEYWTCDVCNKFFSDENGKTEIEEKDTVIAVIPHSYATEWSHNDKEHWQECGCGVKANVATHTFDNACDTTCNDGCGYVRIISHDWEKEYTYGENEHWIECSICDTEKENSRETHHGGSATCEKQAVCADCKQSYGNTAPHNYIEQKEDQFIKTPATCMSGAVYCKSCEYCDAESTETFNGTEKDTTNHTGNNTPINAKAATCYAKGYTGDSQCECGTIVAYGKAIDEIAHTPGTEVEYNDTHHWKECTVSECNAILGKVELDKVQHAFDNACDTTCNGCGYTRTINHTWETEYTCGENEHWIECSICDTEKENSREAHHGGSATCEKQAVCADCKQSYGNTAPHNYIEQKEDQFIKTPATCMSGAVYCKSCEYCDAESTQTFNGTEKDATNHTGNNTPINAKAATCYAKGYTGDSQCECGTIVAYGKAIDEIAHTPGTEVKYDDTHHWKECIVPECGAEVDKTEHAFDNACDTVCNECAYSRTIEHVWKTEYTHDGEYHWYECSECGEEKSNSKAAHNYEAVVDEKYLKSAESCEDKAVYYKSCSECGSQGTETFEDGEALGHSIKAVPEKAATCENAGNTAYWTCERCNTCYDSADAINVIELESTIIAKIAHSYKDGECVYCADKKEEETTTPTSPTTGDASNVMLWSLFALVSCGSVITIIYRKKAKR